MPDELSSPGPRSAPKAPEPEPQAAGQTLPTAAPLAALGATPAASGAAPRRSVRLRAFLVSLILLAAGAALGTGGFFLEQSQVSWRPQVERTGDGWRIRTSHGLRLGAAALGPGHIVWNAGPFTLLTDLVTGRSKLLGARAFAGDLSAPSTSARFVTWMDVRYQGPDVVWAYDMATRRRAQLHGTEGIRRSPALAGSVAVWAADLGAGRGFQIRGADLITGKRLVVADTPVADDLIAGGDLAAWVSRLATSEPPVISVADVRAGVRRQVAPYAPGRGARLVGFAVAGRCLVWARDSGSGTAGQIVSFNIDSGAIKVLANATALGGVAAGGDLVVWADTGSPSETRVMAVLLSETAPFVVALVPGRTPTDVYASGGMAAWRVESLLLFDSYLETARAVGGRQTAEASR